MKTSSMTHAYNVIQLLPIDDHPIVEDLTERLNRLFASYGSVCGKKKLKENMEKTKMMMMRSIFSPMGNMSCKLGMENTRKKKKKNRQRYPNPATLDHLVVS